MTIELQNIKKNFPINNGIFLKKGCVKAVDGVSLKINHGEVFGLVGESGCGKSTLGKLFTRLYHPTSGKIIYDGVDITENKTFTYKKKMQIVFQDPYSSLDPHMNIGDIIGEALTIHGLIQSKDSKQAKIKKLLSDVGLIEKDAHRYPYELSGGQRQRVSLARAMAVRPEFLVLDEPVSSLDVSIQAQILNTLVDLKEQYHLSYLFISHDLSVVKYMADRIGVMYYGKLVEIANSDDLIFHSLHPYTKLLLSSILSFEKNARYSMENNNNIYLPERSPIKMIGCHFQTRCPYATRMCSETKVSLKLISNEHFVACHNCRAHAELANLERS